MGLILLLIGIFTGTWPLAIIGLIVILAKDN